MKTPRILFALLAVVPATLPAFELDSAFGTGGRVVFDDGVSREARGAVLQRDGKIVVVGSTPGIRDSAVAGPADPTRDVFVMRFNANGTPDTTFGHGGIETFDFGSGTEDTGISIAEQADGRLVIVGSSVSSPEWTAAAVARLLPNGSLDTSFHGNGLAVLPEVGLEARAVTIQPDGKLLLTASRSPQNFTVARLRTDGTLDSTYGGNGTGVAMLPNGGPSPAIPYFDALRGIAVQADGKAVSAAYRANNYGIEPIIHAGAIRLDANGVPDSEFGAAGLVLLPQTLKSWGEAPQLIVVLPNGSLLLAGSQNFTGAYGISPPPGYGSTMAVAFRLNPNGTLDTTFGVNGWAREIHGRSVDNTAEGLALLANGQILVGGTTAANVASGSPQGMVVSRLTSNGMLDAGFGTQGHFIVDFSQSNPTDTSQAHALLVQPDGGIVLAGVRQADARSSQPHYRIALARLCEPTVYFPSTATTVAESAATVSLTVRRACGANGGPVSVKYSTNVGTATAGSDFTASSGTLTWQAGDPDDKTILVTLANDTQDEPNELFSVALSEPSGGALGAATSHVVTINDDDETPLPTPPVAKGGGGALDYMTLLGLLAIGLLPRLLRSARAVARNTSMFSMRHTRTRC